MNSCEGCVVLRNEILSFRENVSASFERLFNLFAQQQVCIDAMPQKVVASLFDCGIPALQSMMQGVSAAGATCGSDPVNFGSEDMQQEDDNSDDAANAGELSDGPADAPFMGRQVDSIMPAIQDNTVRFLEPFGDSIAVVKIEEPDVDEKIDESDRLLQFNSLAESHFSDENLGASVSGEGDRDLVKAEISEHFDEGLVGGSSPDVGSLIREYSKLFTVDREVAGKMVAELHGQCSICDRVFSTRNLRSTLFHHIRNVHLGRKHSCSMCGYTIKDRRNVVKHIRSAHPSVTSVDSRIGVVYDPRLPRKATMIDV